MRRNAPLGRAQRLVLHLLADRPKSAFTLYYDWPGLELSSIYSAITSLGRRGLIDAAAGEWHRGRFVHTYALTESGREVEAALVREGDDAD